MVEALIAESDKIQPVRRYVKRERITPDGNDPLAWVKKFQVTYDMGLEIPDIENWPKNLIGSDKTQIQSDIKLPVSRRLRLVSGGNGVISLGDLYEKEGSTTGDALDKLGLLLYTPIGSKTYSHGAEVDEDGEEGKPFANIQDQVQEIPSI